MPWINSSRSSRRVIVMGVFSIACILLALRTTPLRISQEHDQLREVGKLTLQGSDFLRQITDDRTNNIVDQFRDLVRGHVANLHQATPDNAAIDPARGGA